MKMFLTAIALAVATPAAAQTGAPADLHAGHVVAPAAAPSAAATLTAKPAHQGVTGGQMMMDPMTMREHRAQMSASGHKMACCEKMKEAKPLDSHAGHKVDQQR